MKKLIFLSDVHFSDKQPVSRIDDIYQAGIRKLEYIIDYVNENDAIILHSGDLTHTPRNWNILNKLIEILETAENPFYSIFGQHDMVGLNRENNILSTLDKIEFIKILKKEYIDYLTFKFDLYGRSWNDDIVPYEMFKDKNKLNILLIHYSISDIELNFVSTSANSFIKKFKNTIICCGDIHRKFKIYDKERNVLLINSGPLIRRSIIEKDHQPGFWEIDIDDLGDFGNKIKWHEIPDCNAEFSDKHIQLKNEQRQFKIDMDKYFNQIKGDKKYQSFKEAMNRFLTDMDNQDIKNKLSYFMKRG